MPSKRRASLMGTWYPGVAHENQTMFQSYKKAYPGLQKGEIGGIVPHAGWMFSGKLAFSVFQSYSEHNPDVVVVFGGHLLDKHQPIVLHNSSWETPFGEMPFDEAITSQLLQKTDCKEDTGYLEDNTIEVHIPMVKYLFPESKLVAMHLPPSQTAADTALALDQIIKQNKKSVVYFGSTDLTHYGPRFRFTPKGKGQEALAWVRDENDKKFIEFALELNLDSLINHANQNKAACSAGAAAGILAIAKSHGVERGELIDYFTSSDVNPDDNFVGYAGILY
jgi:MEMO1 family protein